MFSPLLSSEKTAFIPVGCCSSFASKTEAGGGGGGGGGPPAPETGVGGGDGTAGAAEDEALARFSSKEPPWAFQDGPVETGVVTQIHPRAGIPSATALRLLKNLEVRLASFTSTALTMTSLIGASADWNTGLDASTGADLEAAWRNLRSSSSAFSNSLACSATKGSILSEISTKGVTYSSKNLSNASMDGASF
ncbi:hypothetical protein OGATHE_005594 [Ogataea polymorpha]|uniref:Uncharacterized protein n=1 Tax=Ogataea polymorpha TaxID=460523 RepID=A0A9P8NUZ3_9ASCO|nr:hypothetical protein OGATHE_005594 [Ogataea polymorpha]